MKRVICSCCGEVVKDIYKEVDDKVICISCFRRDYNVESDSNKLSANVVV